MHVIFKDILLKWQTVIEVRNNTILVIVEM